MAAAGSANTSGEADVSEAANDDIKVFIKEPDRRHDSRDIPISSIPGGGIEGGGGCGGL